MYNRNLADRLRKVFLENFSALDLAEPMLCFDWERSPGEVRPILENEGAFVAGVRVAGRICGYLLTTELRDAANLPLREFKEEEIVAENASLAELLDRMKDREWVFVSLYGEVTRLVTRQDLGKPPMRMWIFGMITILEMNVTWALEEIYPEESWTSQLSPGRVAKARELQRERLRRGERCRLIDCLQLPDKGAALVKDPRSRVLLGFESRLEAKGLIKDLESLRNNLVHSQDIIGRNLPAILRLASSLDSLITAEGVRRLVRERQRGR